MTPGQGTQFTREGEGHEKILDRQQFLPLALQPAGGVVVLATRATAVTAGAVTGLRIVAGGTIEKDLSALRCATGQHRRQGTALVAGEAMAILSDKPVLVTLNQGGKFHQAGLPAGGIDSWLTKVLMSRAVSCCTGSVSWV